MEKVVKVVKVEKGSPKGRLSPIVFTAVILFLTIFPKQIPAMVGIGGYVPFGFSTQKESNGDTNATTFHPMVSLNGIVTSIFGQLFVPELGLVEHLGEYDEYRKRTIFVLFDLAYVVNDSFLLRYGVGTFMTRISGDGGSVELNNGNTTQTFYRTSESITSYNTTLDFGMELAYNKNYAFKLEGYLFGLFDANSRKISYSLSLNYYL